MDFGEVFTKAWKIIWKFKILWIFGILASCGQRGGGGGGGGGSTGWQYSSRELDLSPGMRQFFNQMESFFENIQGWEIAAFVVGFFLFILVMILITSAINTFGEVGLIRGTVMADDGAETLTFGKIFNEVKPYFWRVFGFNILAALAVMLLITLLVIPFIGIGILTAGIGLICLIPFICLLVPAVWVISIYFKQIALAMVVDDKSIKDGIIQGWEYFRNNLGIMLIIGLILGLGSLILGIFLMVPLIFVTIPSIIGMVAAYVTGNELLLGSGIAAAIAGFFIYLPIVILLGGVIASFVQAVWTLTYLRLTRTADTGKETIILSPEEIE